MKIEIGSVGHANVYATELQEARFDPEEKINFSLPAKISDFNEKRCRTIEIFVPKGGRAIYGMLGGCFEPDIGSKIDIKINVLNKVLVPYNKSLAAKVDDVHVGLPRDFANAVEKALRALVESDEPQLNSGKLTISVSAHGAVGSSEFVYEKLTLLLHRLFSLSDSEVCEKSIESKLQM